MPYSIQSDIILEVKPTISVETEAVVADGILSPVQSITYVLLSANDVYETQKSSNFHDAGVIEVVVGPYDPSTTKAVTPSCEAFEVALPITLSFVGTGPTQVSTFRPSYAVAVRNGVPDASENEIVDEIFLGWETALLAAGFKRRTSLQEPFFKYVLPIGEKQGAKNQASETNFVLPPNQPQTNIQPIMPITQAVGMSASTNNSQAALSGFGGFWDSLTLPKAIVIASVMFFLGSGLYAFAGTTADKNLVSHAADRGTPMSFDASSGLTPSSSTHSTPETSAKSFADAHTDQVNAVLKQVGIDTSQPHDLGCLVE